MIASNEAHSATPRTDPEPYVSPINGIRFYVQHYGYLTFQPRPEYSQNIEDYQ